MTTRVCILGNSHIAALREAWREDSTRWPTVDATFVGAHKDLLLDTEFKDGHLLPTTKDAAEELKRLGGITALRLADYDAFVITGGLVSVATAATVYRDLHWPDLPSMAELDDLAAGPVLMTSRVAAVATLEEVLAGRLGPRLAGHLRGMTQAPIYLTSQPRISAEIRTTRAPKTHAHRLALRRGDAAELSRMFEQAATRALAKHKATFLRQPPQTIAAHILTAKRYMQNAPRLTANGGIPQPLDDIRHANAAYGALVLDQIAKAVS